MFKTVAWVSLFLTIIVCGAALLPIREKHVIYYNELLKSSNPDDQPHLLSYSQQKREGVSKQIWYQDETPLYFRINSDDSELFFFRQENQVEVIEQLGKVSGVMQEELFFENGVPMQKVRYIEAKSASYNYSTHLFVAETVELWQYRLEGHEPPLTMANHPPLMHATAHSVEFTLKGEKLNFVAHRMRAALNTKAGLL